LGGKETHHSILVDHLRGRRKLSGIVEEPPTVLGTDKSRGEKRMRKFAVYVAGQRTVFNRFKYQGR